MRDNIRTDSIGLRAMSGSLFVVIVVPSREREIFFFFRYQHLLIRNNNKPIIMPVSKTGFPSVATSLYTTCPLSSLRVSMIHTGSSVHRLIFKLCFLSFYKTH